MIAVQCFENHIFVMELSFCALFFPLEIAHSDMEDCVLLNDYICLLKSRVILTLLTFFAGLLPTLKISFPPPLAIMAWRPPARRIDSAAMPE